MTSREAVPNPLPLDTTAPGADLTARVPRRSDQLRALEERSAAAIMSALFEQSPLSTLIADPEGRPLAVNAAFERLWGIGVAALPPEWTLLRDAQLEAQGLLPLVARAFTGETVTLPSVHYDASLVGGRGSTWSQVHLYPVRETSGDVAAVVLVQLDLTAHLAAEEELRLAEERLRIALDAGRLGAFEWNFRTDVVRWSETLERIHGLEPGTFGGTPADYERDIHPDDIEHVHATVRRTLAGEPHVLSYRIIRPDGRVRWVEARGRLFRDASGAPERLVGVCADATDRRRAEERVRFLSEATAALNATLDPQETMRLLARLMVPTLADCCVLDVVHDDTVRRFLAAPPGASWSAEAEEAERAPADPAREDDPFGQVIRSGLPLLVEDWHERVGDADPHARLLRASGARSVMIAPVLAPGGDVVGALSLIATGREREYGEDDIELAIEIGRRAATAIENARLHESLRGAHERLEHQAMELELQARQLQDQTLELESQQDELQRQMDAVQRLNAELQAANDALSDATAVAERARVVAEGSERYVRGILEAITDAFVVHDADWRFRYVNSAAAEVLRTSDRGGRESLLGRRVWDEYPELIGTPLEREMRRAMVERVPVTFEDYYARGGTWAEIRCYPLPDGGLATSWKDITARKRAEEARIYLMEASTLLASSLDHETTLAAVARLVVPRLADWCAVYVADEEGEDPRTLAVAHVDPAKVELARELQRRYPQDWRSDHGVARVVRTGRPELIRQIPDELLTAAARDEEHLRILRQLGLVSVMMVPLVVRDTVLGAISLVSAESGRRYDEEDLALASELARRAALAVDNARLYRRSEAARAEAEQANRAKSEFLAIMSHELRTPLNAIGGYAQLLEMEVHGPVTAEQREDLERIQRSQRHLLGLINDVLNYAKLEAGRVQYEIRDVPLPDVLAEVDGLIGPQLRAKGLRYQQDPPTVPAAVRADVEKARQVLLNLLTNAVKFTDSGGAVRLSVEVAERTVRLRVHDTGIGIPADKLESIFEPFVQLSRGLTGAQEGTGLGLAISRDLARAMGGELTVTSEVGKGSVFTFELPRA